MPAYLADGEDVTPATASEAAAGVAGGAPARVVVTADETPMESPVGRELMAEPLIRVAAEAAADTAGHKKLSCLGIEDEPFGRSAGQHSLRIGTHATPGGLVTRSAYGHTCDADTDVTLLGRATSVERPHGCPSLRRRLHLRAIFTALGADMDQSFILGRRRAEIDLALAIATKRALTEEQ